MSTLSQLHLRFSLLLLLRLPPLPAFFHILGAQSHGNASFGKLMVYYTLFQRKTQVNILLRQLAADNGAPALTATLAPQHTNPRNHCPQVLPAKLEFGGQ